jgi:hypothetical protein
LRSARGVSELLEPSVPLPVDVPLVLALPLLVLLVFIDELLAFIDPLFPALLVEEFIEAFVPLVDEFIDELPLEPELPVAPVAPLVLLPVLLEPVLWASAAPPAMPIAPTATAASFMIAFIVIS